MESRATKIQAVIRGSLTRKRLKRDPHFARLFQSHRESIGRTGLYDGASLDDFGHEDLLQFSHRRYEERKRLRDSAMIGDEKLFTLPSEEEPSRIEGKEKSQIFSENDGIGSLSESEEGNPHEQTKEELPKVEGLTLTSGEPDQPPDSQPSVSPHLPSDSKPPTDEAASSPVQPPSPPVTDAPPLPSDPLPLEPALPSPTHPAVLEQPQDPPQDPPLDRPETLQQTDISASANLPAASKDLQGAEYSPTEAKAGSESYEQPPSSDLSRPHPASDSIEAESPDRVTLPAVLPESIPATDQPETHTERKAESPEDERQPSPPSFRAGASSRGESWAAHAEEAASLAGPTSNEEAMSLWKRGAESPWAAEDKGISQFPSWGGALRGSDGSSEEPDRPEFPLNTDTHRSEGEKAASTEGKLGEGAAEESGRGGELERERDSRDENTPLPGIGRELVFAELERAPPLPEEQTELPLAVPEELPQSDTESSQAGNTQEHPQSEESKEMPLQKDAVEPPLVETVTPLHEEAQETPLIEAVQEPVPTEEAKASTSHQEPAFEDPKEPPLTTPQPLSDSLEIPPIASPEDNESLEEATSHPPEAVSEPPALEATSGRKEDTQSSHVSHRLLDTVTHPETEKPALAHADHTEDSEADEPTPDPENTDKVAAPVPPISDSKERTESPPIPPHDPTPMEVDSPEKDASPHPQDEAEFPSDANPASSSEAEYQDEFIPESVPSHRKSESSPVLAASAVPQIYEPSEILPATPPLALESDSASSHDSSEPAKATVLKMEQQPTFRQEGPQKSYYHPPTSEPHSVEKHLERMVSPQTGESVQPSYRTPSFPISYKTSSRDTSQMLTGSVVVEDSAHKEESSEGAKESLSNRLDTASPVEEILPVDSTPSKDSPKFAKESEVQISQPVVITMFDVGKEHTHPNDDHAKRSSSSSSSDSSEFYSELQEAQKTDSIAVISTGEMLPKIATSVTPVGDFRPRIMKGEQTTKPPKPGFAMKPITKIFPRPKNTKSFSQDVSLSYITSETPTLPTKKSVKSHANSVLRQTLPSYSKRPVSDMLSVSKLEESKDKLKKTKCIRAQTTDHKMLAPPLPIKRKPSPYDFQWSKRMLEKVFRIGVEVKVRPTIYLPDMRVRKLRKGAAHSFTKAIDLPEIMATNPKEMQEREFVNQIKDAL